MTVRATVRMVISLTLLLGGGWTRAAAAADSGCIISGRVKALKTEEPLSGVLVRLSGTAYWTHTDSSGEFRLEPMDAGFVLVIAEAPGYIPFTQPLDASQLQTVHLEIGLQKYVPPPPPPGSSRFSLRLRGGYGYFSLGDYNRAFGDYRYFAPTRSFEEIEGSPLHLGPDLEIEGVVPLSETWHLGIGVGFLRAADTYRASANFIGPFLHSYRREFTALSTPVFATLIYNRRYSTFRLYWGLGAGYYPVTVRLVDEDLFQESGPIASRGEVSGGGLGFHQVYAVEYFLGRRLGVAVELRARLASVSGLTGIRRVASPRGRFEENVGLYLYGFPQTNEEVMVLLPGAGRTGGLSRAEPASVSFTGAQMLIAFNLYL